MRKLIIAAILVVTAAGCGGSSASGGNGGGGGGGGGGAAGTAAVTFDGHAYNLTNGICIDVGVLGLEGWFGDYSNGEAGDGDYLSFIISSSKVSSVGGRSGGAPWALADGKQSGTLNGRQGTFSGTDFVSGKQVSGTFNCG
jgi:hypothetical protein